MSDIRTLTDDWLDAKVNRPLASLLVHRIRHTRISPNQITLVAAGLGVLAAVCVTRSAGLWGVCAALLLLAYTVLDCADGQLARLRGGGTFTGRMWDGFADWAVALSLHVGLLVYLMAAGPTVFGRPLGSFGTGLLVGVAGLSMAIHSVLYDLQKNRFKRLTGQEGAENDQPDAVRARIAIARGLGQRVLLRLYCLYCLVQARLTPARVAHPGEAATPLSAGELHRVEREMQLWRVLGPTVHLWMIGASALLQSRFSWGFHLYLSYVVVFGNAWMLAVLAWRHVQSVGRQSEANAVAGS